MGLTYLVRSGLRIPDYWHPRLEIQPGFESGKIGLYPFSMAAKADWVGRMQDRVPQPNRKGRVLPVVVALYGLGSYDALVLSRQSRYEAQMWSALQWLEKNAVPLGSGIGWPNESMPVYRLVAPWYSGIVQGFALSLFSRAHAVDPGERWANMTRRTWLGFQCSVEEGGFARTVPEGTIYEEYPTVELDCAFNGMCHALIGLCEAAASGLVPEAERDFRHGLNALHARLHRFDDGGWSLYSLNQCLGKPFLASPYYHRANGLLAQIIGRLADEQEFRSYGVRWVRTGQSLSLRVRKSLRILLDRAAYARRLQTASTRTGAPQRAGT